MSLVGSGFRTAFRPLSLLEPLLLLYMSFLQLLGLLLVPLFGLLLSGFIRVSPNYLLMFLVLSLLQLLSLLILLLLQLLLLLFIFPVDLWIAGRGRSMSLKSWKIFGMNG